MAKDEWMCPRCGLEGDHLRTNDPNRCRPCCTQDAAPDLLVVAKRVVRGGMSYPKYDRDMAAAAIAKAEGKSC